MTQPRIVVCGSHFGGLKAVEGLIQHGYGVQHVVCPTAEQAARHAISGYADYRELAARYGIPLYRPRSFDLRDPEDIEFFEGGKYDLLIQGGWQRLFPGEVLATLRLGAIGIHGGPDPLPIGRGRSPMNWALATGARRFILQLFLIKPGIDDGDVFEREDFDISQFDDIETMYFKYAMAYERMLRRSLPKLIDGTASMRPQTGFATYLPKRTDADGAIDWSSMDIWQIYDRVRAQTKPYPGAHALIGSTRYRIWRCRPFDTRLEYPEAEYGGCVERFGDRLVIKCRGGLLLLDEIEPMDEATDHSQR